jgi:hypothetical protein
LVAIELRHADVADQATSGTVDLLIVRLSRPRAFGDMSLTCAPAVGEDAHDERTCVGIVLDHQHAHFLEPRDLFGGMIRSGDAR